MGVVSERNPQHWAQASCVHRASFREGGHWGDGPCSPWKDGVLPGSCRIAPPELRAPGSSSRQVGVLVGPLLPPQTEGSSVTLQL